ncbi:MAG: hypothetical protein U0Z53_14420 [Blastocatellia bacterium]
MASNKIRQSEIFPMDDDFAAVRLKLPLPVIRYEIHITGRIKAAGRRCGRYQLDAEELDRIRRDLIPLFRSESKARLPNYSPAVRAAWKVPDRQSGNEDATESLLAA